MRQLLNTLYVTTPNAWLRLEGDTLVVEIEREKKLQVPLHHLGGIVTFGDTMLTPALLHRCADDGRSVALLDRNGQFKARLEGAVNGNILLRQAQYVAATDPVRTLALARASIAGKLRNSRNLLLRGAREAESDPERESLRQAATLVAGHLRRLPEATELDTVRGLEGDAARLYFEALNFVVRNAQRPVFTFTVRSRRPPLDRFNALISFLYTLLTHDCRAALEGVGLDPQLGFLHVVRPGRPALALDLVEEFRAPLADRLALTLINRGQLGERDFDIRTGGACYLSADGRRTVIAAYQQRKQEEARHPLLKEPVPIGLLPHLQARLLARTLRGDLPDYVPYLQR